MQLFGASSDQTKGCSNAVLTFFYNFYKFQTFLWISSALPSLIELSNENIFKGISGLNHAGRSNNGIRRLAWMVIFLVGFAGTLHSIIVVVQEIVSYPVETTVTITTDTNVCTERGVWSFARFWRWGFGKFPQLVGRYCSYLLPKQTGELPNFLFTKPSEWPVHS